MTAGAKRVSRALATSCGVALCALACSAGGPAPVSPSGVAEEQLLPARVRRLSNAELELAARALLQAPLDEDIRISARLPPDVRQAGYTRSVEQSVSPVLAVRWAALATELSRHAAADPERHFMECDAPECRERFILGSARAAWRRAPSAEELASLARVFEQGASAATARPVDTADARARSGVALVLNALMQSPSFLYVTELGEFTPSSGSTHHVVRLTDYEIASHLSFTLSGGPPDVALLDRAERGELREPEARIEEARRIMARSFTRHHFRRFVLEWLEVDQLQNTAKNGEAHPDYERLKTHMLDETRAYVDEIMVNYGASVRGLLIGGFASVDPSMARYYGLDAFGPVVPLTRTRRVGVLQHASFLSMHAHPDTTSPVLRGDFVLRKVLCKELPRPSELGIEVVMPSPKPGQSTRARFDQHTADPACKTCHQSIDPIGYTFEAFDEAGAARRLDAEQPVNTKTTLELFGETVRFEDSSDLSHWLAKHPRTPECFARQAFRYFSAQSDPRTEPLFLEVARGLAPEVRGNLVELLIAYAGSESFIHRAVVEGVTQKAKP